MLSNNKRQFAVACPMQVTPWERCMPSGKKDMHAYYEDLACRIKIAVFLGLILTGAMLWIKISSIRTENRLAENPSVYFLRGGDAFYTNLNSAYPSTYILAPLSSDGGIPSGNEIHAGSVHFR
jgi:hypothetical protein